MKRFFKKASLLLVVLCLVVGSVLPSFAAIRGVEGVVTYSDSKCLDRGDGTTTSTYKYYCFTGNYDTTTGDATNFVIRIEGRVGDLDTHNYWLVLDVETTYIASNANGYYHLERDDNDATIEGRYIELVANNETNTDAPKQYLSAYAWLDYYGTAEGAEDWTDYYTCKWLRGSAGWVED